MLLNTYFYCCCPFAVLVYELNPACLNLTCEPSAQEPGRLEITVTICYFVVNLHFEVYECGP